jgi:hypothetical protein
MDRASQSRRSRQATPWHGWRAVVRRGKSSRVESWSDRSWKLSWLPYRAKTRKRAACLGWRGESCLAASFADVPGLVRASLAFARLVPSHRGRRVKSSRSSRGESWHVMMYRGRRVGPALGISYPTSRVLSGPSPRVSHRAASSYFALSGPARSGLVQPWFGRPAVSSREWPSRVATRLMSRPPPWLVVACHSSSGRVALVQSRRIAAGESSRVMLRRVESRHGLSSPVIPWQLRGGDGCPERRIRWPQ